MHDWSGPPAAESMAAAIREARRIEHRHAEGIAD